MQLYDPQRHERLDGDDWSEARARGAIERIVADAERGFSAAGLWPIHPFDVSPERPTALKPLYHGAAGVIWALDHLVRTGAVAQCADFLPIVGELSERHHADLRDNAEANAYMGPAVASYLGGDAGMWMLQWKLARSAALSERIHHALGVNPGDSRGLLWGAAGSMVAAALMHSLTGEARWQTLYVRHFDGLWDRWTHAAEFNCWVWTDELYGVTETRLGALHGFVANAYAIVRGAHLLRPQQRDAAFERVAQTLRSTVLMQDGRANWPHDVGASTRPQRMPILLQFCAGAPGVVACMTELSAATGGSLDALLRAAGELIWEAGPTTKFPVLCHGAVGAGYAVLKLYARFGDDVWLTRARALAMHGVERAERAAQHYGQRKYSLWTGDLGLAVFLWDCVRANAQLPTLDVF